MENLKSKYSIFFKRDFFNTYPNRWALISHAITGLITISLYWYTAQAVAPKLEFERQIGSDYFLFVILGELALLIPATLLYNYVRIIKEMHASGGLNEFIVQPINKVRFLIEAGISGVLFRMINIFAILLTLKFIFKSEVSVDPLLTSFALVFVSLPAFIGLGLLAAALVLTFGRGEKSVIMLSNAAYILGGVYFPTQVFPSWFRETLNYVSPFNILLNGVRGVFAQNPEFTFIGTVAPLLTIGLIFFVMGYIVLQGAFYYFNRRQKPLII